MTRPWRQTDANRCLLLCEWPEADRLRWEAAQRPADPLEPDAGYASRWAPTTLTLIENGYGRWLGHLQRTGHLVGDDPGARASRERVRAYLDELEAAGLADYSRSARLQQLANCLRAIAPGQDWSWVSRGGHRVHAAAVPRRDLRARLRPADEVLTLGKDLMQAAEHDRFRTPCDRAKLFRDGLIISLLVLRVFRNSNFHRLSLGTHLQKRGADWWLVLQDREVKTGRGMEVCWPAEIANDLDRYLEHHRPILLQGDPRGRPQVALWISQRGTPMGKDAIAFQVRDRTLETFGEAINPHSFRHIAATTIATVDPDNAADIAAVLGHSSLTASDRHYNRGRTIDAGRRYQQEIGAQRAKSKKRAD